MPNLLNFRRAILRHKQKTSHHPGEAYLLAAAISGKEKQEIPFLL
jgi:hypothetical protein